MLRSLAAAALLAAAIPAQTAYLVDSDQDQLYTVDLTNGNVTLIGSTLNNGLGTPADLCWRDDTNELFTIDLSGGEVGTLDVTNGTFTVLYNTGLSGWQAMAWDHSTQLFYLANQNDTLYTLDPVTSAFTLVGSTNSAWLVTAMEVDAGGNLVGMDFSSGAILSIDKTTAVGTAGALVTPTNFQSLAISSNGLWYGVNTTTDSLYGIDPVTGTALLIGANPGTQFAKGFTIADSAIQSGGSACPDGNNEARRMSWTGASNIGGILQLGIEQGSVSLPAFLLFGWSTEQLGPYSLPLDMANFGAPGCNLYMSMDTGVGPLGTGQLVPIPIAPSPRLVGLCVYAQGAVIDTGTNPNALGLVFTDFVHIVVTR